MRQNACYLHISTEVLIIMSSPGQKKGTCGHIMTCLMIMTYV